MKPTNASPGPTGFSFGPTESEDYEMYAGHPVTWPQFNEGIMLESWNLRNPKLLRERLEAYSDAGVYVFAQAYPYNSANDQFEANRERLLRLYQHVGFIKAAGGYVYRPPKCKSTKP